MKNLKFAAIVFLLGLEVFAMESIGRVVKVHGEVMNHQDGSSQSLKRGDHLYVGAKITSGKKSFVKIFMKDDTIFQLGPNSEFSLEKFEFTTKAERTAVYNLAKGKLRSLFTVKAPTRSLKIKTPTASMGVRGTEILSDVYKYKGKVTTDIALLSGSLEIQTKGIQKRMLIKPGFVYQSSLSDSIKKNAIKSKIRRMDKRVFARAKSAKNIKNIFLNDVRRNIDKKLVKDVKFEVKKVENKKIRLPASEQKKLNKKQIKDLKSPIKNDKINRIKIPTKNNQIDITKVNMKSTNFLKMRKASINKRIQTGVIQNSIDRSIASPPPPPKVYDTSLPPPINESGWNP